jgi:hypothetical protein
VKSLRSIGVLLIVAAFSGHLHAQGNEVITHARPLHVRHFAGTVVDPRGLTVEFATIELRDPRDHRLLATTFADENGFFSFDDKKYGKMVELRAYQKNFKVADYTAVRKPFGDVHIRLVLSVAD